MVEITQKPLATSAQQNPKQSRFKTWLAQPNNRNIFSVLALGFFFVIVMLGVLIAQRQLANRDATAPNAPASQPEAAAGICTLQFTVPPASPGPLNFNCTKSAYANDPRNGNPEQGGRYYLLTEKSVFRPSEIVVFDVVFINNGTYTIDLEMVDSFSDRNISNILEFVDSECGVGAFNPTTNTLTCQIADVPPQGSTTISSTKHRSFRMRVKPGVTSGTSVTNTVRITPIAIDDPDGPGGPGDQLAAGTSETPNRTALPESRACAITIRIETPPATPSPTPTPPTYACNSVCKSDSQCQTANSNYFCYYSANDTVPTNDTVTTGRCRLKTNPTEAACKIAATPSPTPTPRVSPTPTPTPTPTPATYACNGGCSTDAQCQTVNAGYVCHPDLRVCRLDSNRSSTSCQPQTNTYACNSSCSTNAQCQTANGSYICSNGQCRLGSNPTASNCLSTTYVPPTPTVGCNQNCANNSDCTNPDHICATTADGNRCRLADYTNSENCARPPQVVTSTPGTQPELPQELPQTGALDFGVWVKAGLAALGIGAVLLLLL